MAWLHQGLYLSIVNAPPLLSLLPPTCIQQYPVHVLIAYASIAKNLLLVLLLFEMEFHFVMMLIWTF